MQNLDFQTCFKEVSETVNIYFRYLHLGYFYTELSRRMNFVEIVKDINIGMGNNENYFLKGQLISEMLNELYSNPDKQSFFIYLTIINSVRGISMAVFEALKNQDFQNALKQDIFNGDDDWFLNFQGLIRFTRNTLSHNIRDRILLTDDNYRRQMNWWKNNGKPDNNKISFIYDYADTASIASRLKYDYKAKVFITIDWDNIGNNTTYADVINTYQNFLLAEFIYNIIIIIRQNYFSTLNNP